MYSPLAPFPLNRSRRLRQSGWIRDMVAGAALTVDDLIWPIFVREGVGIIEPIASMPGVNRLSVDEAVKAANEAAALGVTDPTIYI